MACVASHTAACLCVVLLTGCSSRTRSSRKPLRCACSAPDSANVRPHRMRHSLSLMVLTWAGLAGAADEPQLVVQHSLARIGQEIATEHCGAKAKVSRQPVKNRFDEPVLDQRETVRCKNLVLVVYRASIQSPPLEILEWLTVHGAHTKLPKPITPGATRSEVLAFAGKPTQTDRTSLVYLLNDEGPDQHTATFKFAGRRLVSVTWWWSEQ